MSTARKPYDSTVARIAGNLLSGNPSPARATQRLLDGSDGRLSQGSRDLVTQAVALARAIVAETIRTEPLREEKGASHESD